MDNNLVLDPCAIANGEMGKKELVKAIMDAATGCGLTAIEKLRFYRELEKAAGAAVKEKDSEFGMSADDAATIQAESLPEVQQIIAEARAEELKEDVPTKKKKAKKTFLYNGLSYTIKEDIAYDFASNPQKYNQQECVDWRNQKQILVDIDDELDEIKERQANAKQQMAKDERKYLRNHPDCDRTIKRKVVVL